MGQIIGDGDVTCRCAERRTSIGNIVAAVIRSDVGTVRREARFVAVTMVEDAKRATQAKLRQARARLSR